MISTIAPALRDFLKKESAGGILLMIAAALAVLVANSPLAGLYRDWLAVPVVAGIGGAVIDKPLILWINDGLMAVFFFLVGLEVKREVMTGQLSSWRKASLPLVMAVGGMALPAMIFAAMNWGDPQALRGWAIPAATDIAFALGVLALLGSRVPVALKALLLAVAVIDDIGAIAVIALFYTESVAMEMLVGAAITLGAMIALNRARVADSWPYVVLTVVLWVFVLKSGVHATLAGVAAAMTVPLAARGQEPLIRMEHALHYYVAFLIIPIFGFANAGVSLAGISLSDILAPLPLGIALGLLLGKQIGIFGFGWLAVKSGITQLPEGVGWRQLHAMSLLAAIGFTMSLFIGNLAFADPAFINQVKIGVLSGSLIAAVTGYLLLKSSLPDKAASTSGEGVPANA
ncbi:Na+/H+ antiporter NhaA [Sphingomicrobium aestuariivivum]|uniref:Na+/H+ antiporter NhaA n=1 Tax=Sphingomicrobium aestuariivivum TaxID=1582356 RepID=UPI001FD64B30|nr:Na+/H+ antiporter NhaA [Sphingomicrobium aestuariivivum]MCJ8191906.1 Na+/H+ antiporter NhaA [Sphingomicrobium aestuariivivum]